jgi:hypothetical protein
MYQAMMEFDKLLHREADKRCVNWKCCNRKSSFLHAAMMYMKEEANYRNALLEELDYPPKFYAEKVGILTLDAARIAMDNALIKMSYAESEMRSVCGEEQ